QEALNVNALQERFQLLLADPLFERLNARLLPGGALGEAIVDIDAVRASPWRVSLFANNHGAPAVGSTVAGVEAGVRNLTGWGDHLGLTLARNSGEGTNYDLAWNLPLFARGTTLGLRVARSEASVIEEPLRSAFDIESRLQTREISLTHPLRDD